MYHLIPSHHSRYPGHPPHCCNDIHSLALSISSIYASLISWFIQFRVDTVVGLVCLYTVFTSLTTLTIEYPSEIEHVIPVVRYPRPLYLILTIFHVPLPPSLSPRLSLDIYVYVYLILIAAARHLIILVRTRECFVAEIPPHFIYPPFHVYCEPFLGLTLILCLLVTLSFCCSPHMLSVRCLYLRLRCRMKCPWEIM